MMDSFTKNSIIYAIVEVVILLVGISVYST